MLNPLCQSARVSCVMYRLVSAFISASGCLVHAALLSAAPAIA